MIKVQDDEITIEVLEDSQARQLVAEMILAGEVAGQYGQAHNIALPFQVSRSPALGESCYSYRQIRPSLCEASLYDQVR